MGIDSTDSISTELWITSSSIKAKKKEGKKFSFGDAARFFSVRYFLFRHRDVIFISERARRHQSINQDEEHTEGVGDGKAAAAAAAAVLLLPCCCCCCAAAVQVTDGTHATL